MEVSGELGMGRSCGSASSKRMVMWVRVEVRPETRGRQERYKHRNVRRVSLASITRSHSSTAKGSA